MVTDHRGRSLRWQVSQYQTKHSFRCHYGVNPVGHQQSNPLFHTAKRTLGNSQLGQILAERPTDPGRLPHAHLVEIGQSASHGSIPGDDHIIELKDRADIFKGRIRGRGKGWRGCDHQISICPGKYLHQPVDGITIETVTARHRGQQFAIKRRIASLPAIIPYIRKRGLIQHGDPQIGAGFCRPTLFW